MLSAGGCLHLTAGGSPRHRLRGPPSVEKERCCSFVSGPSGTERLPFPTAEAGRADPGPPLPSSPEGGGLATPDLQLKGDTSVVSRPLVCCTRYKQSRKLIQLTNSTIIFPQQKEKQLQCVPTLATFPSTQPHPSLPGEDA